MRRIVYENPETMIAWAQARTPGGQFREDARAIGLAQNGELVAVTVYDGFAPRYCHVSVAAQPDRPWLTREYLRHAAAFPFLTCRFPRVTCIISENNKRSLRFAEHCGALLEGRLRCAGLDGEDWLIYGLLREECRWLPKTFASLPAGRASVFANHSGERLEVL